eukprot:Sdes_comp18241_c0_seq2m7853
MRKESLFSSSPEINLYSQNGRVSKVACCPQKFPSSPSSFIACGLWDCPSNSSLNFYSSSPQSQETNPSKNHWKPLPCKTPFPGNVTDIKFLSATSILASSSIGAVSLYQETQAVFSQKHQWISLHSLPNSSASCTCLSVRADGSQFVSAGEDGKVSVVGLQTLKVASFPVDSFCVNAVAYLKSDQIVTASISRNLKIWDLRNHQSCSSVLRDLQSAPWDIITSIAVHPSRPTQLCVGNSQGILSFWDIRNPLVPLSHLKIHSSESKFLVFRFFTRDPFSFL